MRRLTNTKKKLLGRLLLAPHTELLAPELGESTKTKPGSLYPSLYGLIDAELIESEWTIDTESGRPAKIYRLTPSGILLARALDANAIEGVAWRQFLLENEVS